MLNTENGQIKISPRAKKLAERTDADLSKATPTGPDGRITERDVNALLDKGLTNADKPVKVEPVVAKEQPAPAPAPKTAPAAAPAKPALPTEEYTDEKLPPIRKAIARSMTASLTEMAQLTLNTSFDATQLLNYRAMVKANGEKLGMNNITINDLILYAVAKTILPEFRNLNAEYHADTESMRFYNQVNLGIAVDTPRGLLVPTVFAADKMSLNELSGEAKVLAKAAKEGTLSPSKMRGASITVTNLGSMGIESFTPVINPPQVAILGVCASVNRLKADGTVYPAMGLSLTFDHRALDGSPAAKFLKTLADNLADFNILLSK